MLNFFIAAVMGLLLRAVFVWELNWLDYKNMLHGHSHVALLGWLYIGFFLMIHGRFLSKEMASKPIYSWLFWLTQMAVTGMMVAFPLQGYAGFSIFFSSLHILLSYLFVFRVWKDHNKEDVQITLLLKTALSLLVLSTLGVWAVAVIMGSGGGGGILYQVAIQFYLHFQFNGWLLFALLTLVLKDFKPVIPWSGFRIVYWLILSSQILTFALVLFWAYKWNWAYYINAVGVVIQLVGLGAILFSKKIAAQKPSLSFSSVAKQFLMLALIVGLIRVAFQTLLVVPVLAEMAVFLRVFIIGFIHLNMLGLFSAYLMFSFFNTYASGSSEDVLKPAIWPFYLGFIGSEMLLFAQGFYIWQKWGTLTYFHEGMFLLSCFLPLGIFIYMYLFHRNSHNGVEMLSIEV
ncbi:hypothetical protein [Cyclobacterium qasimii]|nr:hypothetical protein [Cyclobacterium qasimii]GEO22800.1 hypothetical protein CQA01_33340 [Cyclobacterium qasimii]